MDKQQLFKKYNINESHNQWNNQIDDWMSVEIYRLMHGGELPSQNDDSVGWVCEFLDKKDDLAWWAANVMVRADWGSLYLTAKRMVYNLADEILKELGCNKCRDKKGCDIGNMYTCDKCGRKVP